LDGRALDGNYSHENFKNSKVGDDLHIVTDSDSIFLLGMTPRNEMIPVNDGFWWKESKYFSEWSRGYILNQTIFDPHMDELKSAGYKVLVYWHAKNLSKSWDPVSRKVERLLDLYGSVDLNFKKSHGTAPVLLKDFLWKPLRFIQRIFYLGLNSAVVLPVNAPIWSTTKNDNYSIQKALVIRVFHLPKEFRREIKKIFRIHRLETLFANVKKIFGIS
jgi:hypothetical protein